MRLGAFFDARGREARPRFPEEHGYWLFDEDDYLLYALLCDPVYCAELLGEDASNHEYVGQYVVRDYQYPLFRAEGNYCGFTCARYVGKALESSEPVLTPEGWVPIGDLRVGDEVIGSSGRATEVLGVYPQGQRDLYDVEFDDETVVRCDADHLWAVTCDSWLRRKTGVQLRTTAQLMASRMRYKVRSVAPVHYGTFAKLPLSPWLLGCLLAEGGFTSKSITFTSAEQEMVDRVAAELGDAGELAPNGGIDYYIRAPKAGGGGPPAALTHFRAWGLHGKHCSELAIPPEYLRAAVNDRLELLRGLVDGDGTITHSGGVEVSISSERLARDIRQLALSLGGKARIRRGSSGYRDPATGTRISCRDRFRVTLNLPEGMIPCALSRKVATFQARNSQRVRDMSWRGIRSIRSAARGDATCIEVAAADGMFVTRDFILTHNTQSIIWRAVSHAFRRIRENLLLTAPELIHLLPLTDAVEEAINHCRLTREFLDTRNQRTGFTHRPFGVDYMDGTKIYGRIPRLDGKGVKAMHEPDLIVEEAQNYPEAGWTEVHETVMKDHTNQDGQPDFTYHFYGVHSGARDSGFFSRSDGGGFKVVQITAIQRYGWSAAEKEAAKAAYGSTSSGDYRRNILGEPGGAASPYFSTARLVQCLDQNRESHYNQVEIRVGSDMHQEIRAEDFAEMDLPIGDVLDLPSGYKNVWLGADIGLTVSPTVILLFNEERVGGKPRLKLFRRIHLERFRPVDQRKAFYAIALRYGAGLKGVGIDSTGIGLPMRQEMEDDPEAPKHLLDVMTGYMFNAKVPIGVEPEHVTKDDQGRMRDHFGNTVMEEIVPLTGERRYVTYMPMIEASTRYLRDMVDSTFLLLPFDTKITADMQGETQQRVKRLAGMKSKPNAFHILDAMRAMAQRFNESYVKEALALPEQVPVLDYALD